jgi:hypothetical protein
LVVEAVVVEALVVEAWLSAVKTDVFRGESNWMARLLLWANGEALLGDLVLKL